MHSPYKSMCLIVSHKEDNLSHVKILKHAHQVHQRYVRLASVCVWVSQLCLSSRTQCPTNSWCPSVLQDTVNLPLHSVLQDTGTPWISRTPWIYLHTGSFVQSRGWKLKHKQRRTGNTVKVFKISSHILEVGIQSICYADLLITKLFSILSLENFNGDYIFTILMTDICDLWITEVRNSHKEVVCTLSL